MRDGLRCIAATLVLLALAATAGAAPKFWWKRDWPYRKLVETPREQTFPDAKDVWVSVGGCGHARPDAGDLRVVTPRGDVLPHAVLGFGPGDRCFHQKFGPGTVRHVAGDHLTIAFDKAGEKKVVAAFVEKA